MHHYGNNSPGGTRRQMEELTLIDVMSALDRRYVSAGEWRVMSDIRSHQSSHKHSEGLFSHLYTHTQGFYTEREKNAQTESIVRTINFCKCSCKNVVFLKNAYQHFYNTYHIEVTCV